MDGNGLAQRFYWGFGLWLSVLPALLKPVVASEVADFNRVDPDIVEKTDIFETDILEIVQQELRVEGLRGAANLWLSDSSHWAAREFEQTRALIGNWIDDLEKNSTVLSEPAVLLKQQWIVVQQAEKRWRDSVPLLDHRYFSQWLKAVAAFQGQLIALRIPLSNEKQTDIRQMILQVVLSISKQVDYELCKTVSACMQSVQTVSMFSGGEWNRTTEINQLLSAVYDHPDLNPHARHAIKKTIRIWHFMREGIASDNKKIVPSALLLYRNKLIDRLNAAYRLM